MREKNILIVNPYSSARYLSDELARAGLASTALFAGDPFEGAQSWIDPTLFDRQIVLDRPTFGEVLEAARRVRPDFIVNGYESSLHLTDRLASALLPDVANDPETSDLRSNKFMLHELLSEHDLPHIRQKKVYASAPCAEDLGDIAFPCFCKPANGLACIGAFRAENQRDLQRKMEQAVRDIKLIDVTEYIIQEYVEGEEFLVDSFSLHGNHYISSIQRIHRNRAENTPLCRSTEVVRDSALWNRCADAARTWLTVTGLDNGFSHIELFMDGNGIFRPIEINPRISGMSGYVNKTAKAAHLRSMPDLLIEACRSGIPEESRPDQQIGFSRSLILFNFFDTPLKDPTTALQVFPAVQSWNLLKPVGSRSEPGRSKDLTQADLVVLLRCDDQDELDSVTEKIFALEDAGVLV